MYRKIVPGHSKLKCFYFFGLCFISHRDFAPDSAILSPSLDMSQAFLSQYFISISNAQSARTVRLLLIDSTVKLGISNTIHSEN